MRAGIHRWLLGGLLTGCQPSEVVVYGVVGAGPGEDAAPLAGATVRIRDESGVAFDSATTDAAGEFSVGAPAGQLIFAEVSAEGFATSSFTGVSGLNPSMDVGPGALYGIAEATASEWRARFAGCPGADSDGAMIVGEIRVLELEDSETGEHPLVTTARATVSDLAAESVAIDGCYLNEAGDAYDPAAVQTGASGTFAVFGADPGGHTLVIEYTAVGDEVITAYYEVWVPDAANGVIPKFPAFVEFAF